MDEIYRRMKWLDINQAADWLQRLTGNPLTTTDLLSLCDSRQCDAYANTNGLLGVNINSTVCEQVIGAGIQKVLTPMFLKYAGQEIELEMYYESPPVSNRFRGVITEHPLTTWAAKTQLKDLEALFKPDDIPTLAAKLKPETGSQPNPSELKDVRRELRRERAKREAAEAEIAALHQRIEDINNRLQGNEAHETNECSVVQPMHQPGVMTGGLVFPYATKRLEAMRAAAVKHWESHTPEKRRPTQKEIGLELGEALDLPRQANGEPSREAKVLAGAIKPDNSLDA